MSFDVFARREDRWRLVYTSREETPEKAAREAEKRFPGETLKIVPVEQIDIDLRGREKRNERDAVLYAFLAIILAPFAVLIGGLFLIWLGLSFMDSLSGPGPKKYH